MTADTYRNYFEDSGQAYSHILNPKTGRTVTHRLLSNTVMRDDPTWARRLGHGLVSGKPHASPMPRISKCS